MPFASGTHTTILDIARANLADDVAGLLDETITTHPELTMVSARSIPGINFYTLVRTVLPTVGFRNANEGYPASKGVYENRLVETFIFNPRWEADKAVADRYVDGPEAYIALEASAILEASLAHLGSQFYYGRGTALTCGLETDPTVRGDAKGPFGLLELSEAAGLSESTNPLLIDGGKGVSQTANTGSSVYMVKTGPLHANWVMGNEGSLEVQDPTTERVLDTDGNPFTAYVQEMLGYPGLQVGSVYSFGRIGELSEDAGCGLTDAKLAALWAKFPMAFKPNVIFLSRRSQRQLRDSRLTGTGMTIMADGQPVPFPDNWQGIPFGVTDSISDAEEVAVIS